MSETKRSVGRPSKYNPEQKAITIQYLAAIGGKCARLRARAADCTTRTMAINDGDIAELSLQLAGEYAVTVLGLHSSNYTLISGIVDKDNNVFIPVENEGK